MPALKTNEIDALLQGPTIGRLATVKPTGGPYIVPIWQYWDRESAYVIPRAKARFVEYLLANAHVALSVADDVNAEHSRVLIEGEAHIENGPILMQGRMLEMAREMALRYGGDAGLKYLDRTASQPRFLVRIAPSRITSWRGAWHPRYVDEQ